MISTNSLRLVVLNIISNLESLKFEEKTQHPDFSEYRRYYVQISNWVRGVLAETSKKRSDIFVDCSDAVCLLGGMFI